MRLDTWLIFGLTVAVFVFGAVLMTHDWFATRRHERAMRCPGHRGLGDGCLGGALDDAFTEPTP